MPITYCDDAAMLVCANGAHESHAEHAESTMLRSPGSFALQQITEAAVPTVTGALFPLIAYTCAVCGYVELYSALRVEPGKWGDA